MQEQHRRNVATMRERIEKLNHENAILRKQAEELSKTMEMERLEREQLENTLRVKHAEAEKLEAAVDQTKREIEQRLVDFELESSKVAAKEKEADNLLRERKYAEMLFEKYMGIKMKGEKSGEESWLSFIFTKIDPEDPTREFMLSIALNPAGEYRLLRCLPPLPQDRLEKMVGALNGSPDAFGPFARALRKEFRLLTCDH